MSLTGIVFVFSFSWFLLPSHFIPQQASQADRWIRESHEAILKQPSFEITQTVEQKAAPIIEGKPTTTVQTSRQVTHIEVDMTHGLTRLTTREPTGRDVAVLRRGNNVALKLGKEPWQPPSGPYAKIGAQLANPFACPLPKPGANSPHWVTAGIERNKNEAILIVCTEGNSAVAYAEERIKEGITSAFPDEASRPKVEVLSYTSRHWIRKQDKRRLKAVQEAHQIMTMTRPDGSAIVIDITATTTAAYSRFGQVNIVVPPEARRILDGK